MATRDELTALGKRWAREDRSVDELIALLQGDAANDLSVTLSAYVVELKARYAAEAQRDPLTQLGNRVALTHHLVAESVRAVRYQRILTVALLDLDGFKQVNDTYGHAAGDAALQQFAAMLTGALRQSDQAFRYGGDEFVVLFPETTASGVTDVMARLSEQMTAHGSFSFSWGCATLPDDTREAEALLALADQQLYARKRARHL